MLQLTTNVATCNIKGGWYRGTVAEEGVVEAYQVKREVSRDPTCLCVPKSVWVMAWSPTSQRTPPAAQQSEPAVDRE